MKKRENFFFFFRSANWLPSSKKDLQFVRGICRRNVRDLQLQQENSKYTDARKLKTKREE